MSKTIQITLPETSTARADEIALLTKLVTNLSGTGSYLESLFSPRLLEWFTAQVNNDFPADVMDHFNSTKLELDTLNKAYVAAGTTINRLEAQNRDLLAAKQHEGALEAQLHLIKQDVIALQAKLDQAQKVVEDDAESMEQLITANETLHNQITLLNSRIEDLQAEAGIQEVVVLKLKARIFDIEHGSVLHNEQF